MNNIEEMFKDTIIRDYYGKGYRRYYKSRKWARVLWDLKHPDQSCKGFDIHHKDFDSLNDNIENLERLTRSAHSKIHNLKGKDSRMYGKHPTEETKLKMSISHIGMFSGEKNPMFGMTGKKSPHFGKHPTEETKLKMSINRTGANNPQARAVKINDKIFSTGKEAAQCLNVSPNTIINRIRRNVPGYSYMEGDK